MDREYPDRARNAGLGGVVEMQCLVGYSGTLSCRVDREAPSGWGFGEAATALTERMVAAPELTNGEPSAGLEFPLALEFVLSN